MFIFVKHCQSELDSGSVLNNRMALSLWNLGAGAVSPSLSAQELAARLPSQRRADPLGLGAPRPEAPPDPDAGAAGGARELLSASDAAALDAEICETGYMSPAAVRALVAENCARGQLEESGLDPELLLLIDARINYKLFIAGDSLYTREELYENYPFHEFGIQPEVVFVAQEVGEFVSAERSGAGEPVYALRDAGDERLVFSPAEDIMRAARGGPPPRVARRIVRTKIFIGREAWEDFLLQMRLCRGGVRMAAAAGMAPALLAAPAVEATPSEQLAERVSRIEDQLLIIFEKLSKLSM